MRCLTMLVVLAASTPLLAEAGTATQAKPSPSKEDKVICRTRAPIGSLIATEKECRTKRDWDNLRVNTTGVSTAGSCASSETGHCL